MDALVGSKVFSARPSFHWLGKNGVAIVIIDDEEIRGAGAGWSNEAAGGVGEDLARDRLAISIDGMGAKGRCLRHWWTKVMIRFKSIRGG